MKAWQRRTVGILMAIYVLRLLLKTTTEAEA